MTTMPEPIDELRALVKEAKGLSDDPPANNKPDMSRPEMPAYLLSAIGVVGIVALTITRHPIPDVLNMVTLAAIGIGGAITSPRAPKA